LAGGLAAKLVAHLWAAKLSQEIRGHLPAACPKMKPEAKCGWVESLKTVRRTAD